MLEEGLRRTGGLARADPPQPARRGQRGARTSGVAKRLVRLFVGGDKIAQSPLDTAQTTAPAAIVAAQPVPQLGHFAA